MMKGRRIYLLRRVQSPFLCPLPSLQAGDSDTGTVFGRHVEYPKDIYLVSILSLLYLHFSFPLLSEGEKIKEYEGSTYDELDYAFPDPHELLISPSPAILRSKGDVLGSIFPISTFASAYAFAHSLLFGFNFFLPSFIPSDLAGTLAVF
jgi:hypothetical protein